MWRDGRSIGKASGEGWEGSTGDGVRQIVMCRYPLSGDPDSVKLYKVYDVMKDGILLAAA